MANATTPWWADLLAMSGQFSWPPAGNSAGRLWAVRIGHWHTNRQTAQV